MTLTQSFTKKLYFLLILVALGMLLLIKIKSIALMLLICALLFGITLSNLNIGIVLILLILPLSSAINEEETASIPLLFSPVFVGAALTNLFLRKQKFYLDRKLIRTYGLILFPVLFVTVIYRYYESFNAVINFGLMIVIAYIISNSYLNYRNLNRQFVVAIALSGLVALYVAMTGSMETSRLTLNSSVRQLANILGFSTVFIVLVLLKYQKEVSVGFKFFLIGALPFLIGGLILTVSRGVLITTILSISLSLFFHFITIGKFRKILSILMGSGAFLLVVYFLGYNYFSTHFSGYLDVLEKRFSRDTVSGGTEIRQYIWKQTLSSFETIELIFGIGIQGFRYKSALEMVNFYAHSVFVDTIASGGIVVFIILLFILLKNFITALKTRNVFSFGLLIFLIFCYMTHGSVGSVEFWLELGMIIGINLQYQKGLNTVLE